MAEEGRKAQQEELGKAAAQACADGDGRALEEALEAGLDPAAAVFGQVLLAHAAQAGSAQCAKILLAAGAAADGAGSAGCTALMAACGGKRPGCLAAVDLLLAAGADPDAQDNSGQTAAMFAADWGNEEALERLAGAGADFAKRDALGQSAIYRALSSPYSSARAAGIIWAAGGRPKQEPGGSLAGLKETIGRISEMIGEEEASMRMGLVEAAGAREELQKAAGQAKAGARKKAQL